MSENNQSKHYNPTDTNGDTYDFVPAESYNEQPQSYHPQSEDARQYAQVPYPFQENPYAYANKAPYPFVPPTPILYTGQPPIQPKKQLSAGTFLIPLGFMALHMLILTLVSAVAGLFVAFSTIDTGNLDVQNLEKQLIEQIGATQIYALLVAMPILIALYTLAAILLKRRSNPYVYFNAPRTGDVLRAVVIGVGCLGVANLIMLLFQELSKRSTFINQQYDNYLQMTGNISQNTNIFLLILTFCILVPIGEELLFRGLIAGEFRRAMPDWLNILINGLLFALFHMNFIQTSYVLLAGFALAAVGMWSRSLWVPIVLHAVYNFCGSAALVLIGDRVELQALFFIIQMACIVLGVFFAIWSYQRRKKEVLMVYP